jgi:hypothetical protein
MALRSLSLAPLCQPLPQACFLGMSTLATLPARASAAVRALEAGAPELAANATCPLRQADLLNSEIVALLAPLIAPDVLPSKAVAGGLTLREARIIYEGMGAAIETLSSILQRIVWRDFCTAWDPWTGQTSEVTCLQLPAWTLRMLCLMRAPATLASLTGRLLPAFTLQQDSVTGWHAVQGRLTCPFHVDEADRATAVREAAER